MSDNKITQVTRSRFAPSPTGYMHIGNLRTALFAYLLAKKGDGQFILRIEDTDRERYVEGATDIIYNTLKTCGLIWDEGPDKGGNYGPYIQSERMGLYKEYAEKLIENGHAYRCFCSKERLEQLSVVQKASGVSPMYDRHCRHLTKEEIKAKLDAGEGYVIRQAIPEDGHTSFHDELFGDIDVNNEILDDQILIKTDGMPTYNFANVIDDHLMNITHVVRGNEYLSSTPKYNLLYKAFGWQPPTYVHVNHIMKNEKEKLSKRNGDASFNDLLEKGYYTPAILNYIALLGWSPRGEREIFSLEELVQEFEISRLSKSPAIFDPLKLKAINAHYIRELPFDKFKEIAMPYVRQSCKNEKVNIELLLKTVQTRTELFTDIPEQVDFIDELPDYDIELYRNKKMKTSPETALEALNAALPVLEQLESFDFDAIHNAMFDLIAKLGVKNGWLLWAIRVAVSGKQFTPGGGIELCAVLGKEETLKRIRVGIDKLS